MSGVQRRRYSRCVFEADVGFFSAGAKKRRWGKCVNISHGGIQVKSDPILKSGDNLTLIINFPDLPEACAIPCVVRWNNPDNTTAGLQFKSLRPIEVWGLNQLMNKLKRTTDPQSTTV